MNPPAMTSMQRVLTSLGQREPDRVPLFLLFSLHGAKVLGCSIQEYFSKPERVVEGQLRLRALYPHDCLYAFYYASLEHEAFGGKTIFIDDGPPNAGDPIIQKPADILHLRPPRIEDCPGLQRVLETQRQLKRQVQDEVPIIGVVMSPFSLPVMQMGFEKYLDLMADSPDLLARLLEINQEFCVEWANAQLENGATAICYFDPVSSTTIVTRQQYLQSGFPCAKATLSRIQGPTATHFASGRCLPLMDDLIQTGTALVGVSVDEDMRQLKAAARGRVSLLGNLNGIAMCRWTPQQAELEVKKIIQAAGKGGGLIISDHHGELPYQVSAEVLSAISETVRAYGMYPLDL
jgi:uroporphyrinogen decarboxylase